MSGGPGSAGTPNRLADTREAVGKQYALAEKPVVLEPTGVDTTVFVLNHPLMTGVLWPLTTCTTRPALDSDT